MAGLALVAFLAAAAAHADPRGVWRTEGGKSHVEIYGCDGDKLCGRIVWLKSPLDKNGRPKRDAGNDDEALRGRPILGMRMVWNMEDQGGGEWDDGRIYNPNNGKIYSAEMEEIDADTLEVSGCVLFMCKGQTWKRVR